MTTIDYKGYRIESAGVLFMIYSNDSSALCSTWELASAKRWIDRRAERTEVVCPHCDRTISVTSKGLTRKHKNDGTGKTCQGSGRPSDMFERIID